MHNIKDLRKNLESFNKKFKNRNLNFDVEKFNKLDELNRKFLKKFLYFQKNKMKAKKI